MRTYGLLFACLLGTLPAFGAEKGVDYYSAAQLQQLGKTLSTEAKTNGLVAHPLEKYLNDSTLMVYRDASGSAELHKHAADLYVVVKGEATLLSGGKMVKPNTVREGELVAKTIDGGHSQKLSPGDVVHIEANTPHQLLLQPGHTFSYFVLKVKE